MSGAVKPPQFYAGPYVPSGVLYGHDLPSFSHWLVPGYERHIDEFGIINLYECTSWCCRPVVKQEGRA